MYHDSCVKRLVVDMYILSKKSPWRGRERGGGSCYYV